ncbi:MAG: NfeD family protein [Verrucomicrobiales bacterium]
MQYSLSVFQSISNVVISIGFNLKAFRWQCLAFLVGAMAGASAQDDERIEGGWKNRPVVLEVGRYAFVTRQQGEYLRNSLTKASASGASGIILSINCPGGLASEMRKFVEIVVKLKVPVISWIVGDASGAGAIAALAADKVYFSKNTRLGGEVEAIDWRGPAEHLPGRLTDLRYYDLANELAGLIASRGWPQQVVRGLCDPEEEVIVGGIKYSNSGDVLSLDAPHALKAGIAGGVAEDLETLLSAAGMSGEPVSAVAPETLILRARTAVPSDGTGSEEAEAISGADSSTAEDVEEKRVFGQTRLESYAGKIVVIPVEMESLIRKTKFEFLQRIIKKADDDRASAIIFDLNTPGGIAWYTEEIMLSDLQQLSIPTYSFVNPKAMSAGALIAIATDRIYMHPPSTIGAAAPVMGTGQDIPETMMKKVMGDILATADDVARRKGHNPKIAKAFIDTKIEIAFELPVISPEGALDKRDAFDPDTENDLLVLNSSQAVEIIDGRHLFAEGTANSIEDLIAQEGIEGDIVTAKPLGFEMVADWIVKLAPWLLLFGIAGAYMELKAPGFGVPGFVALICFGLFFFGHSVAGYIAGFESIGFFLLGIVLVIVEFFVFPGLLVFGIAGFALIFGSLVFAMIDPIKLNWEGGFSLSAIGSVLTGPMINLTIAVIGAGLLIMLLLRYLPSLPVFRGLVLDSGVGKGTGIEPLSVSGVTGDCSIGLEAGNVIGLSGRAETDLRPSGMARIGNQRFDVVSTGEFIESGAKIRIVEQEGSRIAVERC